MTGHCSTPAEIEARAEEERILLVGPANVGKSCLFTGLTKKFVNVSNYPGTTVEITAARKDELLWLDTPGMTGLIPTSEEEEVTLRILLEKEDDIVVAVIDARDLPRGLSMLAALSDFQHRFVVALNMYDEALDAGIEIEVAKLESEIGVPVVPTVAVRRQGISRLRHRLVEAARLKIAPREPRDVENLLGEVAEGFSDRTHPRIRARLALGGRRDLAGIRDAAEAERIGEYRRRFSVSYGVSYTGLYARSRSVAVAPILEKVFHSPRSSGTGWSSLLGDFAVHPLWGWPILLAVLWCVYEFVGVFGAGTIVDFIENTVFGKWFLPWLSSVLGRIPPGFVRDFLISDLAGGWNGLLVGPYGLVSMGVTYSIAIILPVVSTFFLAFSFMEDSGYLPRLAVMLDRPFRAMGLNGRAVLPLVLGLGCDTMATMTARILPSRKERLLVTFLLALAIPCSAQLGVIGALMVSLSLKAILVWVVVILGVLLVAGWIGSRVLPGTPDPFLMPLPPMRLPRLGNILVKTVARTEWYLREAVPLFIIGTFILWLLAAVHVLGKIETLFAPVVVGMLGLPREAARAFLMGFLRRDYGAAGLYAIFKQGLTGGTLPPAMEVDLVVALVTITLFVPCVANFLMIGKERGWKTAAWIGLITMIAALGVGTGTRVLLEALGWAG